MSRGQPRAGNIIVCHRSAPVGRCCCRQLSDHRYGMSRGLATSDADDGAKGGTPVGLDAKIVSRAFASVRRPLLTGRGAIRRVHAKLRALRPIGGVGSGGSTPVFATRLGGCLVHCFRIFSSLLVCIVASLVVSVANAREVQAGPIWNNMDAQNKCPGVCQQNGNARWNGQCIRSPARRPRCVTATAGILRRCRLRSRSGRRQGALFNQFDAQNKCPGVCQQGGGGSWDGNWKTTQPGRMSVCSCTGSGGSPGFGAGPPAMRKCGADVRDAASNAALASVRHARRTHRQRSHAQRRHELRRQRPVRLPLKVDADQPVTRRVHGLAGDACAVVDAAEIDRFFVVVVDSPLGGRREADHGGGRGPHVHARASSRDRRRPPEPCPAPT